MTPRLAKPAALAVGLAILASGCGGASSGTKLADGTTLVESAGVWAPDSRSIARVGADGIEIVDTDGNRLRSIFVRTPTRGLGWAEDGNALLFLSKEPDQKPDRSERVGSVRLGRRPSFAPLGTHAGSLSWSPGGWPLAFATDYRGLLVGHGPIGPEPSLWTMDGLDRRPRRILNLPGEESFPRFSPDGRTILFGLAREDGRSGGLWTVRSDGSKPRRLVAGVDGEAASWSPDGRWVALTATIHPDRRRRLYVVSSAGGQLRKLSPDEVRAAVPPAWTPDGNWITFPTFEGEVKRVRPDGSGLGTIANFPRQEIWHLAWSPDGKYLSYTAEPIYDGD